ncbi:Uma2 family endonuclease [Desulfobulbus sp. TB]|nr:Uma2 family endonuclease [Desulfobulbus sp. TB]
MKKECAVRTHQGTKIADVARVSAETFQRIKDEVECSVAPEVCIEVRSASNTAEEMKDKRSLYFANGCQGSMAL